MTIVAVVLLVMTAAILVAVDVDCIIRYRHVFREEVGGRDNPLAMMASFCPPGWMPAGLLSGPVVATEEALRADCAVALARLPNQRRPPSQAWRAR
jgi:hypothetical protein